MKVDVNTFNMVKRNLNLGLQLTRTVVLKLGHFSAIFIFPAYHKVHEPSTKDPTTASALNNMTGTDNASGSKPPDDNYIVVNEVI